MFSHLVYRELGSCAPQSLRGKEGIRWRFSLNVSRTKAIQSEHRGVVTSLDLDKSECRYLLSSGSAGAIQVMDVQNVLEAGEETFAPLVHVLPFRRTGGYACSLWYPHDTGLFLSLAFSGHVRVWDTNTQQVIMEKAYGARGNALAMSPCASNHYLVAVSTAHNELKLMDLRTGMDTWILEGHRGAIVTAQWSPCEPHVLISGSADTSIRLWDIRKPNGSPIMFDPHKVIARHLSDDEVREPPSKRARSDYPDPFQRRKQMTLSAHHGAVTGVCFLPHGDQFVSSGNDHRMRLWNCADGSLESVNFPGAVNSSSLMTQMATSSDGSLIFHGNGNDIGVYSAETGQRVFDLDEHFDSVQCLHYHPQHEDGAMKVWTPELVEERLNGVAEGTRGGRGTNEEMDVSEWSE